MGSLVFVLIVAGIAGLAYFQYRVRQVRIRAVAMLAARIGLAPGMIFGVRALQSVPVQTFSSGSFVSTRAPLPTRF